MALRVTKRQQRRQHGRRSQRGQPAVAAVRPARHHTVGQRQADPVDCRQTQPGQRSRDRIQPTQRERQHTAKRPKPFERLRRQSAGQQPAPGRVQPRRVGDRPALGGACRPALGRYSHSGQHRRGSGAGQQPERGTHALVARGVAARPGGQRPVAPEPDAQLPRAQPGQPDCPPHPTSPKAAC